MGYTHMHIAHLLTNIIIYLIYILSQHLLSQHLGTSPGNSYDSCCSTAVPVPTLCVDASASDVRPGNIIMCLMRHFLHVVNLSLLAVVVSCTQSDVQHLIPRVPVQWLLQALLI